jgi:hypothetical protein
MLPATLEAPMLVTVQSSEEVTQGTRFDADHPLDIFPFFCPSVCHLGEGQSRCLYNNVNTGIP